jgi:TRAP-type C4-dicarboxylate transport system permease small subunit
MDESGKRDWLGWCNYVLFVFTWPILAALLILCCYSTIARYLLGKPLHGAQEVSEYTLPVILFSTMAYVLEKKKHIAIDMVVPHLSAKGKIAVEILSYFSILFLALLLVWGGTELAVAKISVYSGTDPRFPLFPFYVSVPIGSGLLFLQALKGLCVSFGKLRMNIKGSNQ